MSIPSDTDFSVPMGRSTSANREQQIELPPEGSTISVLNKRSDPSQNEALATFCFYRFTFTGAE